MNWLDRLRKAGMIPGLRAPIAGMNWVDRFDLSTVGHLLILVKDLKGNVIDQREGKNLVVNGGRTAVSHLVAGDDVANREIASMTFGDGTGTVAVTDTTLFGATIITKPTTFTFPVSTPQTQVQFEADILPGEGNGSGSQIYMEAALVCGDNTTFFSHKVFGSLTKTSDLAITALWTFIF